MNLQKIHKAGILLLTLNLAACAGMGVNDEGPSSSSMAPFSVINEPHADRIPVSGRERDYDWLREVTLEVRLGENDAGGVPLRYLLEALSSHGIRVSTDLPVDNLMYRGFSIPSGTDGLTALEIITKQMNLEYELHSGPRHQPYVSITDIDDEAILINADGESGQLVAEESSSSKEDRWLKDGNFSWSESSGRVRFQMRSGRLLPQIRELARHIDGVAVLPENDNWFQWEVSPNYEWPNTVELEEESVEHLIDRLMLSYNLNINVMKNGVVLIHD